MANCVVRFFYYCSNEAVHDENDHRDVLFDDDEDADDDFDNNN